MSKLKCSRSPATAEITRFAFAGKRETRIVFFTLAGARGITCRKWRVRARRRTRKSHVSRTPANVKRGSCFPRQPARTKSRVGNRVFALAGKRENLCFLVWLSIFRCSQFVDDLQTKVPLVIFFYVFHVGDNSALE